MPSVSEENQSNDRSLVRGFASGSVVLHVALWPRCVTCMVLFINCGLNVVTDYADEHVD